MDFHGDAVYVNRYDRDEDEVGDLDFDLLFPPGHDHDDHHVVPRRRPAFEHLRDYDGQDLPGPGPPPPMERQQDAAPGELYPGGEETNGGAGDNK